ncbi:hypothetical protein R9C00_24685 [Flammeovirgaceae bacterium SG7u.111]|nr:hypothetical protein [Flammeovirgaceae bacterium SG7u.132]WPO34896.1 hypothetical protein R9C00_24685 [Flammeovirgaceae bacterium SG7u.111]
MSLLTSKAGNLFEPIEMNSSYFGMTVYELIGWLGAITFIVAYFLLSIKVLSGSKSLYHILNAIGGACLVINAIELQDNPTFVVNIVWTVIALGAVVRIKNGKKAA